MILDTEEQRQKLLSVISMVPINGPFGQIGPVMQDLATLQEQVKMASINVPLNDLRPVPEGQPWP